MLSFLDDNKLITQAQSGFTKNDGTVNQLLSILHLILNNNSNKKTTRSVFLDISKAFDRVWHDQLVAKLDKIGIKGNLLTLLNSYIRNREICVTVDGATSSFYKINARGATRINTGSVAIHNFHK